MSVMKLFGQDIAGKTAAFAFMYVP